MSLALARKYRPKNFADVAVQSHVSNTLRGAIARGRVAHGYLLCGPRGVGKTTLARVLAMALNCENKREDGEPCGICTSCQRIWSGASSLDVVEIDAASNRGVDDARDLRERAMYSPSGDDRYKVYIVDEAHMLTREAWNALLKILEEPPPRVIFVFATTEPQKIAQTAAPVLSRLQRFDLKRIGIADITQRLSTILDKEGVKSSADALAIIARAADGSMRDALSLTDQVISIGGGTVTAERVREALGLVPEDEFLAILDVIAEHRAGDVFGAVNKLANAGIDFGVFLTGFADMLRALLTTVLNGKADGVSAAAAASLAEKKDLFTAGDLLRMISAVNALEPTFRKSGQQQLLIEMLLVRMALLDRTIAIEDLLRGIEGGSSNVEARPESARGSARGSIPQTPVTRGPARPVTRPGYPPQLPAPNALPSEPPDASAPDHGATQLNEMKRAMETTARDSNRSRMTPEALKEERIGMLRQKDPALGAAIDELDLELLD
jgi:DNA polymerase III subunit gamma/tau